MYDTLQEHLDFHYASESEADRAEAIAIGYANPERAWISTDRDAWHQNPYYKGPPKPHPEDDQAWEEYERNPEAWIAAEKERRERRHSDFLQSVDDEIPF